MSDAGAGVVYTPAPLADELVREVLGRALAGASLAQARALRVLDPACGAGALLLAAARFLLSWYAARGVARDEAGACVRAALFGVDVDAAALARAREDLARETGCPGVADDLRRGEALLEVDWTVAFPRATGGFQVVLANPPYVDSQRMTRADPAWRQACARRYAAARGNWDLYCVFIELGLRLCAPGGLCGMIVPNKLASADYARAIRRTLAAEHRLVLVRDHSAAPGWDAGAYPLLFVAERSPPRADDRVTLGHCAVPLAALAAGETWPIGQGDTAASAALTRRGTPLGEIAEVWGAATVAEAYAIAGLIAEGEAGLRVVNSGTIERHEHLWGRAPLRYLGKRYARPVIGAPEGLPPRRLAQARTPKVIVASMTRRLEAVLDAEGELLAGKSTTIVWWPGRDLRLLAAQLNSRAIARHYAQVFGGDRLRAGYLRVGPSQLRRLPVFDPQTADARERGIVAQICGWMDAVAAEGPRPPLLAAIDDAVDALFGLT